jgi:DNA-binding winged helix-turn-helix (wHTH) protein
MARTCALRRLCKLVRAALGRSPIASVETVVGRGFIVENERGRDIG